MKLFLAILAVSALAATAVQADHSHYHNEMHHGSAHHTHADGDWHGEKPHKHNGKWTHRGHTHVKQCSCPSVRWHNTKDLQKWRVSNAGAERCYSDKWENLHW